jgi:fucose permease
VERVAGAAAAGDVRTARMLTFLMFFMFAMTTDSVGLIIPEVIREFHLTLTSAGALQYGSMLGISAAGIGLGFLADRFGRKRAILLGLSIFAATAFLFPAAKTFPAILVLIAVAGIAIGIFKTGALALVGDVSVSASQFTSTMNLVEGFFGVGAIVGPLIVAQLILNGVSWRWLYVVAGILCTLLMLISVVARYPQPSLRGDSVPGLSRTLRLLRHPRALAFSIGALTYVAVESAIYVWMPTLLADIRGPTQPLVAYALPAFFCLRALGRFLGAWTLRYVNWASALALAAVLIFVCFAVSLSGGVGVSLYALPLSGLFMSIVYPTINSRGIGSFPPADHGTVAGIILFFSCAGAILGPLLMGLAGDFYGGAIYCFFVATALAALLAAGALVNWRMKPAETAWGGQSAAAEGLR